MNTLTPHIPLKYEHEHLPAAAELAVDVVIPVYNEQEVLAGSVRRLHEHMSGLGRTFQITIADNASTDDTLAIARRMERELDGIRVLHLDRKGRGRALRAAWGSSTADVVAYMDVDLSTDLRHVGELIEPLLDGSADVAIGSRLSPGARVRRSLRRELISRSYNMILRISLGDGFSDAQCGFKAARREVIAQLLPKIEDDAWFFDTELLHAARVGRFSIREIPVCWIEDADSSVAIIATAAEDLRGVRRLRRADRSAAPSAAARRRPAGAPAAPGAA